MEDPTALKVFATIGVFTVVWGGYVLLKLIAGHLFRWEERP